MASFALHDYSQVLSLVSFPVFRPVPSSSCFLHGFFQCLFHFFLSPTLTPFMSSMNDRGQYLSLSSRRSCLPPGQTRRTGRLVRPALVVSSYDCPPELVQTVSGQHGPRPSGQARWQHSWRGTKVPASLADTASRYRLAPSANTSCCDTL